jgi:tetratricopeptide (TPR) repeat protein
VLGEEHSETLGSMNNLAVLYRGKGRYAESERLYLKTLEIQKRVLGEEHRSTLGTITNLDNLYYSMGRHEDAAPMFETSLPIKRRVLGMQHPWTGFAMRGLAATYEALERPENALPLWIEMLDLQTAAAEAPDANAQSLNNAARTLLMYEIEELRNPTRALAYDRRACEMVETADGANLWMYLDTLALAQHKTGDTAAAIETQKRVVSLIPDDDSKRADAEQRLNQYEAALKAENTPPDKEGNSR